MTTTTTVPQVRPARRAHRAPAFNRRQQSAVLGILGSIALIAMLEFVSRLGLVNEKFLPPFSEVLTTLIGLLGTPAFQQAIAATAGTWVVGIGLSILLAVPLGIVLGLSEVSYRLSRPIIELIRPMPAVALIPLVILVAGQGLEMKVIVAVYAAVWPIIFNTLYGVHGTDPRAKEMARSFGQSRFQIVWRIVIPSAGPLISAGVRISSSVVLIVIVTVELMAGGTTGLGAYIGRMRSLGDQVAAVYAGILVAGLLGLVINLILGYAERRLFGWSLTDRGQK